MDFKYRIRDLRREKDITADELGNAVGVSRFSVSNWETGRNQPNNDILMKLCSYFNVSLDYLMGRTDVKQPYKSTSAIKEDDFLVAFSNLSGELTEEDKKSILKIAQSFAASNEAKKEKK